MTHVETPHELVLVNRYDARPEQVWAAWTKPENFVQWWCPPDWTVSDVVMEVQPRGRFQQNAVLTRRHDGDAVRRVLPRGRRARAARLHPQRRAVADDEARTVLTVRLRAADGGTKQEFRQTGMVTDEHFEALKAGTEMFFTRLGEFLAH